MGWNKSRGDGLREWQTIWAMSQRNGLQGICTSRRCFGQPGVDLRGTDYGHV
jgi:hypothetical protein